MQISVTGMARGILTIVLVFGFCTTQSFAQESFNFSDVNPASEVNESNDTAVTQNLSDVPPFAQPKSQAESPQPTGVVSTLSDTTSPPAQGSQITPPFAVPRTSGQAQDGSQNKLKDSFSKLDPFKSLSNKKSLTNKFVPPASPAAALAQENGTSEIPAIDMNMLRRQLEPPADAHVPANPASETVQQDPASQPDPMNVLSPERLAPMNSERVAQRISSEPQVTEPAVGQLQPTEPIESILTGRMLSLIHI